MPRVDIPELTRCCFCLPLRHGLLVWGYFKMVLMSLAVYELMEDIDRWSQFPLAIGCTVVLIVDIVLNLIFVVAGHLKHQLLYWAYYYYSVVVLFIHFIIMLSFVFIRGYFGIVSLLIQITILFLPVIFVQGYVTPLVRTEARKLSNNSSCEFVNRTAEANDAMETTGSSHVPAV